MWNQLAWLVFGSAGWLFWDPPINGAGELRFEPAGRLSGVVVCWPAQQSQSLYDAPDPAYRDPTAQVMREI